MVFGLFRPSRPDFIETGSGRTMFSGVAPLFRPSRPDFIETIWPLAFASLPIPELFRPSRPDFIETGYALDVMVVPKVGLFRPSRPDFIETVAKFVHHTVTEDIVPAF